jgi:ribosomal subunit interface protein
MDVSIRGRNVELSDALRASAHDKVSRLSRYLDGIDHVEIHF